MAAVGGGRHLSGAHISIEFRQLKGSLRRRARGMKKELQRSAVRAAQRGKVLMRRVTPTDQGQLKNSWRVRKGGEVVGSFWLRPKTILAYLENDAPYAGVVERGARPHKVSYLGRMAIYEWVRRNRKLFALSGPRQIVAGPKRRGTRGPMLRALEPDLERITWGIVKRIEREGQKPTFFVRNRLDELRTELGMQVDLGTERESKKPYVSKGRSSSE